MSSLLLAAACDEEDGPGDQEQAADAAADVSTTDAAISRDASVPQCSDAQAADSGDTQLADGGDSQLPDSGIVVDDKGPIEGPLKLSVVADKAKASDVATLVGVYPGNLGVWAPTDGKPARYSESCTITVLADGTLKVTASENTISAQLNGEPLDTVTSPDRDELGRDANAATTVGNDTHAVAVHVLRGYVVSANSRVNDLNNNRLDSVSCYVRDPNPRSVRNGQAKSGTDLGYGGATAADLSKDWVGSYGNGSCTVTIGQDGTLHLVKGAVDVTTRLAGEPGSDWGDALSVFPSSVELQAGSLLSDGGKRVIKLQKSSQGWQASARDPMSTLVDYDSCKGLAKQ